MKYSVSAMNYLFLSQKNSEFQTQLALRDLNKACGLVQISEEVLGTK